MIPSAALTPAVDEVWIDRDGGWPVTVEAVAISRVLVGYLDGRLAWLSFPTLRERYQLAASVSREMLHHGGERESRVSVRSVPPGGIVCTRALGSTAHYCVQERTGPVVLVTVMDAPGLAPGTQIRLAADAVDAMERVA